MVDWVGENERKRTKRKEKKENEPDGRVLSLSDESSEEQDDTEEKRKASQKKRKEKGVKKDKLFGGRGIKSRCGFIEKEEVWIVEHLHSDAQSSRLSTTDSSLDLVSNLVVCSVCQGQCLDQIINLFVSFHSSRFIH